MRSSDWSSDVCSSDLSTDGWERGKPHPDIYLAAAEGLGVDPAACLAIEDSPTGARAALAAGMTVIGFCGAGHIVDRAAHGALLREVGVHHVDRKSTRLNSSH